MSERIIGNLNKTNNHRPECQCDDCLAQSELAEPPGSPRDVTRSTLPRKEWHELAEDLLARYPGIDRAELLKHITASYFLDMKHGNKREERAACDYLNLLQQQATKLRLANARTEPHEPTNERS